MANNIPDFDDLEEELRHQYLLEAYEELYSENKIPYGIATGDNDIWDQYDPVINLARLNYETSFEDD